VNTDDYRKNLVTGFTERYIDEINFSIMLQRESADVRKLIDALYDKYFISGKVKKNTKKK
jgi:TolB-like protein